MRVGSTFLRSTVVLAVLGVTSVYSTGSLYAANAAWNVDAAGNWNTDSNWTAAHPNGIDEVASLTFDITVNRIVTLDGPNTIGTLNIGDPGVTFRSYTVSGANTLTFDVTSGSAMINKTSGVTDTISSNIQLDDNLVVTLAPAFGNITLSGVVSGNAGITRLGNNTTGTRLILSNPANSYTGDTIIGVGNGATDGGTLRATIDGAIPYGLGKGNVVVGPVGILEVTNATNTTLNVNGLTGAAGSIVDLGVNGTNSTLAIGNNDATSTYDGIIRNTASGITSFNLSKVGSGVLTLSGANTYNGTTTVNAGQLIVNGPHTGGAAYTVAIGATLGGTGNISAAVDLFGAISAGNSPGTLTIGGLTLQDDSSSVFELINTAGAHSAGGGNDLISITNALTVGALSPDFLIDVDAIGGGDLNNAGSWILAQYGSLNASSAPNFTVTGIDLVNFTYSVGIVPDGVNPLGPGSVVLTLNPVPEPNSLILLSIGAIGWVSGMRRRSRQEFLTG
jgi:autotransporter-associated beta strand protein